MVQFVTNASGAIWWPNLQPIYICGSIWLFEGLWVSWGKIRVWRTWDVHYHASVFNQWYLSLKCPWQPKFSQEETPFLQTRRLDRVGERAPSSLRDLRLLLSTRSEPTFSGQRWWTCICSPWSPRLLCHWGWGHVDFTTRLLFVDFILVNLPPQDLHSTYTPTR